MSLYRYILRSLWFYRKQHLALFAGAVISTAVLTGALIVGDSVKYSLISLVDVRLGTSRFVLQTADRFVRAELAEEMGRKLQVPVLAMYLSEGVGINPDLDIQVNKLQVLGINPAFGSFFNVAMPEVSGGKALVSANLANKLDLKKGSEMIVRVREAEVIPLNAPFARDAKPSVALRITVAGVVGDDLMGRFGLNSNQAAPFNVFVDQKYLTEQLGTGGLVNTILVSGMEGRTLTPGELDDCLKEVWKPRDLGLKIIELPELGKYEVVSYRIFIDKPIASEIQGSGIPVEEVLTYLVNGIRSTKGKTPYSFVTAASPPYVRQGLGDQEIIINDWLSDDLGLKNGDTITLDYFVVGPLRKLQEQSHTFVVRDITETGKGLVNNSLMPEYPGLTEANNCRDWDTGIPIDLAAIRDKDEFYWDDYKGTPKALISIKMGQELWRNEFGAITAFRMNKSDISRDELERFITSGIDPADLNLVFRPVYEEGIQAATNSVDFGELFLSLSFFVIASGILLIVLLYSLQVQSRMPEAGLLAALGFTRKRIMLYRFAESAFASVFGGLAGAGVGILYNKGLLIGLNSVWNEAVNSYMLDIYLIPRTILIGTLSGMFLSGLTVYLLTAMKLKQPVSGILKNVVTSYTHQRRRIFPLHVVLMVVGFGGALSLVLVSLLGSDDQNASFFLAAGGLFLIGCMAGLGTFLSHRNLKHDPAVPGIFHLAVKNAGRSKARSMTSVALLALGTFTIVITGANRKTFYGAGNDRSSGTGGFSYWTETTMPVNEDMNSPAGRVRLGLGDEKSIDRATFVQLFKLDGDDASCLNLNQVQQPRILGVDPEEFSVREAFTIAGFYPGIDRNNPWSELNKTYTEGVIPAFADQTVITWGLKKKVGDTLYYLNELGKQIKLVLAGGLDNSIFQGNLLIGLQHFRDNFPSVSGSSVVLVDCTSGDCEDLPGVLETQLRDFGIDLETTSNRLAAFNAVENTYLTVFMVLGGLGVIIGTIGLGIVLLRNLLDRREELGLLAALGFRRRDLFLLVLYENVFLLFTGIMIGMLSALIGILPSVISPAYSIPGAFMFWLILAVFISGLMWILLPTRRVMNKPLIAALRNE